MTESTLVKGFGTGAAINAGKLEVVLANLPGLSGVVNPTCEQISAAIIKLWRTNFTNTAWQADADISIYCEKGARTFGEKFTLANGVQYIVKPTTVYLTEVSGDDEIDPTVY